MSQQRPMNDRAPVRRCLSALLVAGLVSVTGCTEDEARVGPAGVGGGIAVVGSDYKSTVISLVDPVSGRVVRDRCLDSGSRAPQLSAALSGDVTLPSEPQPEHELLVIDRAASTLTWLDPARCQVLRQMSVGQGFSSNPQDVVAGPGDKAYVTRYNRNPGRTDEGSDLLVIDRRQATVLGRIALPAPTPAELPAGLAVDPRPTRALRIGDRLYVTLNNLSDDFAAATAGRLAVIDTNRDAVVSTIDLPGLKNCGALLRAPGPSGGEALVAGCAGVYGDGPNQIDSAGFAWIDPSGATPTVQLVPGRTFERTVSGSMLAVVGAQLAFTVLAGDLSGPATDAVWAFDFRGGKPRKILDGAGAFVLALALGRAPDRLYVLDATPADPRVRVFAIAADGVVTADGSFVASDVGLPPRHLGFY
jgi:hypothetical protein